MKLSKLGCRRKGALDVSINSIVVIVFAVTMLGLGLAFMKGYFSKITVDVLPEPPEPSASEPITIPGKTIPIERSKSLEMTVKVYNDDAAGNALPATTIPGITCYKSGNTATSATEVSVTTAPQPIPFGAAAQFPVKVKTTLAKGTYPCTVTMPGGAPNLGFFLDVK